jgi:hypothetical protein
MDKAFDKIAEGLNEAIVIAPYVARIHALEAEVKSLEAQLQEAATDSMILVLQKLAGSQAEVAGWKRVAVEAVIPLEAICAAGTDKLHSDEVRDGIRHAIAVVRQAVMGEGLPAVPPGPTNEICLAQPKLNEAIPCSQDDRQAR